MMRSSVDLPQPDGPTKHDELAVVDLQVDVVDHLHRAEALVDVAKLKLSHSSPPPDVADAWRGFRSP